MAINFAHETITSSELARETSYTDGVANTAEALTITGGPVVEQDARNPLLVRRKKNHGPPKANQLVGLYCLDQSLKAEPVRTIPAQYAVKLVASELAKWCNSFTAIQLLSRIEYDVRGQSCRMSEITVIECWAQSPRHEQLAEAWRGNNSYEDGTARRGKAA